MTNFRRNSMLGFRITPKLKYLEYLNAAALYSGKATRFSVDETFNAIIETSCLFRWADPLTTVTYSLSPVKRPPRRPHAQFLSLYIHILSPPWFYVLNMYWFRNFIYSLQRFLAPSLTHRTYQPYNPLPSLLQRVFLRSPSPVPPTLRPHSLSTQSQYSLHYSFLLFHRHTHRR